MIDREKLVLALRGLMKMTGDNWNYENEIQELADVIAGPEPEVIESEYP